MRVARVIISILLFLSSSPYLNSQQSVPTPQRDPQAVALLQGSSRAMGGVVPADSVATGSVVIVAGSDTDKGTIRILTRGTEQTYEELELSQGGRTISFSDGIAREKINGVAATLSLERTLSARSASFPLPFIAGALSNPDEAFQFVGTEYVDGQQLNHVRLWNTFSSKPSLQTLAEFSMTDLWLDANTALPWRISVTLREGGGSSPRIPLDLYFSNYQNVAGILYPSLIQKSLNGTPWITITISNLSFNTGLSDASFFVQ